MSFKVNLNVLMDCLGIFGGGSLTGQSKSPSLKMYYDGYGEPLQLIIEEGMVYDFESNSDLGGSIVTNWQRLLCC